MRMPENIESELFSRECSSDQLRRQCYNRVLISGNALNG